MMTSFDLVEEMGNLAVGSDSNLPRGPALYCIYVGFSRNSEAGMPRYLTRVP